jgi:hypothetical protein
VFHVLRVTAGVFVVFFIFLQRKCAVILQILSILKEKKCSKSIHKATVRADFRTPEGISELTPFLLPSEVT